MVVLTAVRKGWPALYCTSEPASSYIKNTGIGTVTAMLLSYSITFLVLWTLFLPIEDQPGQRSGEHQARGLRLPLRL